MSLFDVVVVGTGAGGLTAAAEAKKQGAKVALVGNDRPGGDCSYYGCVPTKTLIHSAKVLHYIRRASEYGLPKLHVEPDFSAIMAHKDKVVDEITANGSWEPWERQGFTIFKGTGTFISQHELEVNGEVVQGEKFVIAVGTEAAIPPIEGIKEVDYITNVEAASLKSLPKRLAILGAGPIGMEFGQLFARLGSQVTVLEMAEQVLPKEDPELAAMLQQYLEQEGVEIRTGTKLEKVEKRGQAKVIMVVADGHVQHLEADELLIAVGRKAPLEKLGLEKVGVKTEGGWVAVDETLRTTAPNIWAVGDCTGAYLFTHVAEHQARVVAHNLFAPEQKVLKVDYTVVPWVTFTDPELARVGLTEQEAIEQDIGVKVGRLKFADVERAHMMVEQKGMIKVVVDGENQLLGATILGVHADELIHEFALAMKVGLKVHDILGMIHAYPTLSEAVQDSLSDF